VCVCPCLIVCFSLSLCVSLCISLIVCVSFSVCLCVESLSVCMSVSLSVCVSESTAFACTRPWNINHRVSTRKWLRCLNSVSGLSEPPQLLAYYLGRLFGVEQRAVQLLGILLLGAVGALGLAWAETGGHLSELQFGIAEAAFFVGCVSSALYPVLSKFGLNRGWLSQRAEVRTFWSLLTGSVLVGLLGLIVEAPQQLNNITLLDGLLLAYLGVFSSGMTFWLMQRATAVLTPGAVTAYSYLVPFVSMLLLFIDQPQRIGWHWLPGSLLVMLAIAVLLNRDAANRRPDQPIQSQQRLLEGQAAD